MEENNNLTLNLKIKIPQNHSEYVKKLLTVLNDSQLGEYFIRFLQRHTLNELNNKQDYLENWMFKMLKNITSELVNNQEVLKNNILDQLVNDDSWFQKLKD